MTIESILWRRLDAPGHDACRLEQTGTGWRLDGAAIFRYDESPARLAYHVTCDRAWRTQEGRVYGWVESHSIDTVVVKTAGGAWTHNGILVPNLERCLDLDFGFTPATNLFQLRRVALEVGQAATVLVAWLDVSANTLEILHQRYERRTERTYWYEAPRFDYAALLEVDPSGFIRQYPGLWKAES